MPRTATPRTATPRTFTSSKRPHLDPIDPPIGPPIDQPDQSSLTKPGAKFTVPPELELNVKKIYNGTCVISRNNTSWGNMVSGLAIETCHIIPKAMFKWYPWQNGEPSEQDLWNAVNNIDNCMVMDSISHTIHDNRLLAVHPVSIKPLYLSMLLI
jgi:HNH endonuclease